MTQSSALSPFNFVFFGPIQPHDLTLLLEQIEPELQSY